MNPESLKRSDKYHIHSYEVDFTRRLRFSSLSRYMQESAWKNAEQLGFGYSALVTRNFAWVLTRLVITIDRMPGWNETLYIATWPAGKEQIFAYRDFQFFIDNQEVGRATSSWCVIDMDSRKPVPVDQAFDIQLPDYPQHLFPNRPGKIDSLKKADISWNTLVGYQDLDVNEHVTNSRYIDWVFETIDIEYLKTHTISRLEINFLAEARFGSEIVAQCAQLSDHEYLHRIIQKENNLEICCAKTIWKTS